MSIIPDSGTSRNKPAALSQAAAGSNPPHNREILGGVTLAQLQVLADRLAADLAALALVESPDPSWSPQRLRTWERERRRHVTAERQAAADAAPRPARAGGSDVLSRARAYLASVPGAVSGQHGHDRTFYAANRLVRGFDLTPDQAYPLFAEWNDRCEPPWSEHDLRRKLEQADQRPGPRGFLLNAAPPESSPAGRIGCEMLDLSDLEGPPLEPLVLKDICVKLAAVSTFVFREKVEDKRGHRPDAPPGTANGRRPHHRRATRLQTMSQVRVQAA